MTDWLPFFFFVLILGIVLLSSSFFQKQILPFLEVKEGFEENIPGASDEKTGIIKWLDNKTLYDSFYAKLYDQLTQGSVRTQAEVGLLVTEWTKRGDDLRAFEVLDAGCGTGIATLAFGKLGCKRVVGLDSSQAMLDQAQQIVLPQSTLTEEQKKNVSFRQADFIDPSACAAGEFTHACMLYFTVYYATDKEALFRNFHLWIKPGGKLAVHVVNKHKFDPMLESSAPWMGFSLQKYSKDRITKSEVAFDKFKYTGEFLLTDPAAEFRETFRFADGKVRRQKHEFLMEDLNTIVGFAKAAGWKYDGFVDLTKLSAEYFYILYFTHP